MKFFLITGFCDSGIWAKEFRLKAAFHVLLVIIAGEMVSQGLLGFVQKVISALMVPNLQHLKTQALDISVLWEVFASRVLSRVGVKKEFLMSVFDKN